MNLINFILLMVSARFWKKFRLGVLQCYLFKQIWAPFYTDNTATPANYFEIFRKISKMSENQIVSFRIRDEKGSCSVICDNRSKHLCIIWKGSRNERFLISLFFWKSSGLSVVLNCTIVEHFNTVTLSSQHVAVWPVLTIITTFKIVSKTESNKIQFNEYLKQESKDKDTNFESDPGVWLAMIWANQRLNSYLD